jgi:hypothetical protein
MKTTNSMKLCILAVLMLPFSTVAFAQNSRWHVRAGLDGSYNWFVNTKHSAYSEKGAFSHGASAEVSYTIGKSELALGAAYTRLYGVKDSGGEPDQENLFTVPLQYRFRFMDYFFVGGGLFLDIVSRNPYGRIENHIPRWHKHPYHVMGGAGMGVGAEYVFPSGIFATLHPNLRLSSTGFTSNSAVFGYAGITLKAGYRF